MDYIDPKVQETMFQSALTHWKDYKDKKSWDDMFMRAYECCKAIIKKRAYGICIPELESKALDAATYCMDLINRGNYPAKLSSMCYLHCSKFMYNEKLKRAEREVQLSALQDYQLTMESTNDYDDFDEIL